MYKVVEPIKERVIKPPLILELYETFDQMCQVRGFKNMLDNPKIVSNIIKEHSCCFSIGDFLIYKVFANYATGLKSTEPIDGAFDYVVNNKDYDPHCIIDNHVICLNKKQDVIYIITDNKDNCLGKYFFNEEEAKNYVKFLMCDN